MGLRALLDSRDLGTAFVAVEDGCVIGYLVVVWGFSLELGGRDASVDELYVVPEHRSRGIGSALLDAAEAACAEAGALALHLVAERSNTGAHRLYRRLGFTGYEKSLLTKRLA